MRKINSISATPKTEADGEHLSYNRIKILIQTIPVGLLKG